MGRLLVVQGENLPDVWERSVLEVWNNGDKLKTQYDAPDDPASADCTIVMEIENPFAEPRIHRFIPCGPVELEAYQQEVIDGIHDNWIDPDKGQWEYTYHERLFNYSVPGIDKPVDQVQYIIDALKDCPYSRRAQAVTWKAWEDAGIHDPACLQRIWCRVIDGKLCMNVEMRSNDAFRAAYMNMYAFTELQKTIADQLGVPVGSYIHKADSYHIYSSCFKDMDGFIKALDRPFEDRTYRSDSGVWHEMTEEAKIQVAESLQREKETGRKGL